MAAQVESARVGLIVAVAGLILGLLGLVGTGTLAPGATIAEDRAIELPRSLPHGKGMWMWQVPKTEGGNVDAIVTRALSVGLTHLYVRTGSSWDGFYAGEFLDQLLPVAHAAGLRVYGWDFPRLISVPDDVARAVAAIRHQTPKGEHLDGFAADIETESEGTNISAATAWAYGRGLRESVGYTMPLVAVVPRPSEYRLDFPFREVAADFDAVAPMVYWLNREAGSDVAGALDNLRPLGKPLFPIGQAYDGGPEGGRPGVPSGAELLRFMEVADAGGAEGVSFWSWQEADQQAWDSIRDAPHFKLVEPLDDSNDLTRTRLRVSPH
ncbi:MAG TPA: hypothetical protein VM121_07135 [Acidimicrobiales bacterium]|nr:hypothetical protein [Acidimicrobiales bacterium]